MKKIILWVLLTLPALAVTAQVADSIPARGKVLFGYLSYSEVLKIMPEYRSAQDKLNRLQTKYDEELQRADKEFNRKFAEFLEGQHEFPENIMLKRQKELQDLMDKSIRFKEEIRQILSTAREELTAPVTTKLGEVISQVGEELQLDYILNTDGNACPYISPQTGMDVTPMVKERLNVR